MKLFSDKSLDFISPIWMVISQFIWLIFYSPDSKNRNLCVLRPHLCVGCAAILDFKFFKPKFFKPYTISMFVRYLIYASIY
jgi:hypothetical protein